MATMTTFRILLLLSVVGAASAQGERPAPAAAKPAPVAARFDAHGWPIDAALVAGPVARPQEPKPAGPTPVAKATGPQPKPTSLQNVQFDQSGWPIVAETTPLPAATTRPLAKADADHGRAEPRDAARPRPLAESSRAPERADEIPAIASGMQLGSPLLDVYQATHSPGAWKNIGGLVVWWRVTIHGSQGEPIGVREIVHTLDSAFAERDRLEYADGRVFGRIGAQVFAERSGMPNPNQVEGATHELQLFGTQMRFPWLFADASAFAVLGKEVEDRQGERLRKIVLERRPPASLEVSGPELDPKPRDRFDILHDPSNGLPRELLQRFATSRETRRVLLEDWREFEGVNLPHRRVYVDDSMRATTSLEITRMERQRVTERAFRLR